MLESKREQRVSLAFVRFPVSTKLVLREGSLIKAIGDGRTRPKVVFVPVISGDECMGLAHFNFRRHRQCDTTVEKVSALHGSLSSFRNALSGPRANTAYYASPVGE